ncbi:aminoimidazole riboside kinase [Avibacterium paragallinarum]|uniref:Aminoimidazole riboside kinase n=1 Tax=Avibacterium paragallinarum TaxID=728 RepID=A0A377I9Y7_AVIPA|nr:aminoimidazole riboside kinase [Avibacterium paragallinarum]POY47034.1 aminoimidazole riboside kinase [Avibacterium paragallinarum]RZN77730.1 aminoimidazole riboside kinase [Avibacterium paragallinarum]CDF97770.1 Putative Fructokinase [Avibacterium paragallinarum JF4211]STO72137.1 aminoimidazole riboside kinase [Avibacterium paragallinarum]
MSEKIWVLGDAVVDLIPDGEQHYLRCAGGAPANVAVGVARLGGKSGFIGKVGKDPLGEFMRQTLQKEKVDTAFMTLDPAQRTSTVVVGLDQGERSFTFMVNPSADQFLHVSELPTFAQGQWLHCCSIALINDPSRTATFTAMKAIRQAKGYVSFDPNLRESLWQSLDEMRKVVMQAVALADVLKFSEEELTFLTETDSLEKAFAKITALYPQKLIIVTLGKAGALYHFKGQKDIVAGKALQPVDTTGAGDAFVGGLLAGLSQNSDWQNNRETLVKILRQANACGALATTAKGAMSALPNHAQLQAFLSE